MVVCMSIKHYCKKCGIQLSASDAICPRCGTEISPIKDYEKEKLEKRNIPEVGITGYNQQPSHKTIHDNIKDSSDKDTKNTSVYLINGGVDLKPKRKKKAKGSNKKKGLKTILVLIIIALVGLAVYINMPYINMMALSPSSYYLLNEKKEFSDSFSNINCIMKSFYNQSESYTGSYKINVIDNKLDTTAKNLINSLSLNLSNNVDYVANKTQLSLSLLSEKSEIFRGRIDTEKDKTAISFPEITDDKQIVFDGINLNRLILNDNHDIVVGGLSESEYTSLMLNFTKAVLLPTLDKCDIRIRVGIKDFNYITTVSFEFNDKSFSELKEKAAEFIGNDALVRKLATNILSYDIRNSVSDKMVNEQLDKLANTIRNSDVITQDSLPIYTVSYMPNGTIVSRNLKMGGREIEAWGSKNNYNNLGIRYISVSDNIDFIFTNSYKQNDKIIVGNFNGSLNDKQVLKSAYQLNMNSKIAEISAPIGTADFEIITDNQKLKINVKVDNIKELKRNIGIRAVSTGKDDDFTVELTGVANVSPDISLQNIPIAEKSTFDSSKDIKMVFENFAGKLMDNGYYEVLQKYFGLVKNGKTYEFKN